MLGQMHVLEICHILQMKISEMLHVEFSEGVKLQQGRGKLVTKSVAPQTATLHYGKVSQAWLTNYSNVCNKIVTQTVKISSFFTPTTIYYNNKKKIQPWWVLQFYTLAFKNIVFAVLFHLNLPYEDEVVGTLIRLNDTIDLGSKS